MNNRSVNSGWDLRLVVDLLLIGGHLRDQGVVDVVKRGQVEVRADKSRRASLVLVFVREDVSLMRCSMRCKGRER